MIALLNIAPLVILLLGFLVWRKTDKKKRYMAALGIFALVYLYMLIQPSYMPKGVVERTATPVFAPSEAAIQDRSLKPDTLEERDKRMKEAVQSGLDFKK